jgi:arsenate reductase
MTERPSVLFVCVHNAGRSQMAAGFLRTLGGEGVEVRSAGTAPAESINPVVVEAMREVGVDLASQTPRVLESDVVQASDVVVTMGCGDECPYFPGTTYLDWDLPDPAGKDLAEVRSIRDDIRDRVEALLETLPGGPSRRG